MRIGQGYDAHAFGPGDAVVLGGVRIPHDRGLQGHSDADVLTHAVIDALLGAAGLGDLGAHFPSHDPARKDARSLDLLTEALELLLDRGFRPRQVDATVIAERPRLAAHTAQMRDNLAGTLGAAADYVSVKATSNDGLGWIGRGEGIAALAVAVVEEAPK